MSSQSQQFVVRIEKHPVWYLAHSNGSVNLWSLLFLFRIGLAPLIRGHLLERSHVKLCYGPQASSSILPHLSTGDSLVSLTPF